jgi:DNA-directed RNA polymerase specialized sigma24 family protein
VNVTTAFYLQQRRRLLSYFGKHGVPRHDAEDLVGEVWYRLALADANGQYAEDGRMAAMLTSLARARLMKYREGKIVVDHRAEPVGVFEPNAQPIELQPDRPRARKHTKRRAHR